MTFLQCALTAVLAALPAIVAGGQLKAAGHFSIPLTRHQGLDQRQDAVAARVSHGIARYAARLNGNSAPLTIEPETYNNIQWFGPFNVGDSQNLSLLIDSGSSILAVNPGEYKPSGDSINLKNSSDVIYITWLKDGCGTAALGFKYFADTVSMQGLTAKNFTFASITSPPNIKGYKPRAGYPHDGIVGMTGNDTWFSKICSEGQVEECRFGLALGTGGKGKQIFGGVDSSLFEGELAYPTYPVPANVVINGTDTVLSNQLVLAFDDGTSDIIASASAAKKIFEKLGIQAVEYPRLQGCDFKVVLGYYPCDNPPVVGFSFHLADGTAMNNTSKAFNIEPEGFQLYDNGNNNCTSSIVGWDNPNFGAKSTLLIGQAWYQGKYVDQNADGTRFAFATLKDKTGLIS